MRKVSLSIRVRLSKVIEVRNSFMCVENDKLFGVVGVKYEV